MNREYNETSKGVVITDKERMNIEEEIRLFREQIEADQGAHGEIKEAITSLREDVQPLIDEAETLGKVAEFYETASIVKRVTTKAWVYFVGFVIAIGAIISAAKGWIDLNVFSR